ncbi:ABC-type metal ion transport system, periplasmic component/surface adhesin [Thermoplasmatales archaeon SCGC AB-540-F20]|nr:ABC-type metal ion transport system, periplasmic component/surface adhesin [Thermoplasmatales archaeon SCGC AB-540-F20]
MNHIWKRKYMLICIIAMLLLSFFTITTQAEETKTAIICTNSILADFTSNLLTENVTIEYIMPAGVCPAHFDTCPSDVSKIASADVIISLGWEPGLPVLLESSGNTEYKEIKCAQLGRNGICLPTPKNMLKEYEMN